MNTIVKRNVLIGYVWICSGQSNMGWYVGQCDNAAEACAAATSPIIRFWTDRWVTCSPPSAGHMSAVGNFFGKRIAEETKVPIGWVSCSMGGTAIEPWMSPEGMCLVPELAGMLKDYELIGTKYRNDQLAYIAAVEEWVEKARAAHSASQAFPRLPNAPEHSNLFTLHSSYFVRHTGLPIKGFLWYQEESNGQEGEVYYRKMRGLILGLRALWKQGDFPFYFVQLPGYQGPSNDPAGGDGWAPFRTVQAKALQIPNSGMAVTIDLNPKGEIHPANKEDVGSRLALLALRNDYGRKDLVCSGSMFSGMKIENNRVRLSFDSVGGGLMIGKKQGHGPAVEDLNGKLSRFAIAGEDKKWVWADAVIEVANVVVSSPAVPQPVAVRYAYSGNPVGSNLYNREGLPAMPFRTDAWITE